MRESKPTMVLSILQKRILVLAGCLALLPTCSDRADSAEAGSSARTSTTRYLIGEAASGQQLLQVENDRTVATHELGLSTMFATAGSTLALVTGTPEGSTFRVFDGRSKSFVYSAVHNDHFLLTPISGLERWLALGDNGKSIYYVSLQAGVEGVEHTVHKLDLRSGTDTDYALPSTLSSPRLVGAGDRISVCDETDRGVAILVPDKTSFRLVVPSLGRSAASPEGISDCLTVPQAGLFRVSRDGAIEQMTDTNYSAVARAVVYRGGDKIAHAQPAIYKGQPVIVYGASSTDDGAFAEVVVLDPVGRKELLRRPVEGGATALYADPGGQFFEYIDQELKGLWRAELENPKAQLIANLPAAWGERRGRCAILGTLEPME